MYCLQLAVTSSRNTLATVQPLKLRLKIIPPLAGLVHFKSAVRTGVRNDTYHDILVQSTSEYSFTNILCIEKESKKVRTWYRSFLSHLELGQNIKKSRFRFTFQ